MSSLPSNLSWGPEGRGRQDQSDTIVVRDKPLTVYIVGEVIFPNFVKDGMARRKAGILVKPLVDADFESLQAILQELSQPALRKSLSRYRPVVALLTPAFTSVQPTAAQ